MYADSFLSTHPVGKGGKAVPYCPPALFDKDAAGISKSLLKSVVDANNNRTYIDGPRWASRGAINAGMAVFVYLDQVERGAVEILPGYDQCEQLSGTSSP